MNVLITGAGGQLGTDAVYWCSRSGDTVTPTDRIDLDVRDRDQVLAAVMTVRPDAIIHCAAYTAVDSCEADVDRAFDSNALAVRWIADAARRAGSHLVTVSTDYVFDGTSTRPYHEWDIPNPQSVYGRSKLEGEREALSAGIGATVVRTSWVCGAHGSNMVRTVLGLLGSGHRRLRFVDDQRGCPTFTADLAVMLRTLAVQRVPGVVHVTNQGATTWYEFVREIVRLAGEDPDIVEPITTDQLDPPRPAPRPANSELDNRVLRNMGLPLLRHHQEALAALMAPIDTMDASG
jgi:dTDP-4-dehydrorhamnose reductase